MGIKVIATMDLTIYDKLNTENASLISNFTMLELGEPNEKQTLRVMQSRARHLEDYHKIKIPAPVINYAYKKAKALESDLRFPQKGIDLLDRACAKLILKESKVPQRYKSLIDETILLAGKIDESIETGDYKTALKHRSNLQKVETKLSSDEKSMFLSQKLTLTTEIVDIAIEEEEMSKSTPLPVEDLKSLKDRVRKRIIGQDSAIDVVVKSLIRSKLGLNSKKRPVGNFLFLGPTGVGKTELAKVLADEAFGTGSLIRLDMSDFSEKHTVARLVGAPPGYVGFGEGGELTKKIELKPQSVVLFDEIEKAHPDILNILLQIMEEGQLVDAVGTAFNFNEAIVILTSNLGTEILHRKDIGFDNELKSEDNVESRLTSNLKRFIKPELINRFDEVIVFRRLSKQSQSRILEILLTEFKTSLKYKKITLVVEKEVKTFLLEKGYSQEFGARSMRRLIEKELIDRVAAHILDTNIKDASQIRLYARLSNSKIVISSK
jgi:ATP-dependent Clp protease ATP-binding subunit ClpC